MYTIILLCQKGQHLYIGIAFSCEWTGLIQKCFKTYLGFIIIYFSGGVLILLFTYVNLYLLVLLFILSFIVSYGG